MNLTNIGLALSLLQDLGPLITNTITGIQTARTENRDLTSEELDAIKANYTAAHSKLLADEAAAIAAGDTSAG